MGRRQTAAEKHGRKRQLDQAGRGDLTREKKEQREHANDQGYHSPGPQGSHCGIKFRRRMFRTIA